MSNMEKCGQCESDQKDNTKPVANTEEAKHPAYLKDEKLIRELKAYIPDVETIFNVHRRIGAGTFSTVFLATLRCHEDLSPTKRKLFAVKYVIPTSHPNRIERELKCLSEIGGVDNIVSVELCLRRNDNVAFVMPYVPHDKFHTYFNKMDARDLQAYMRNLLLAIKRVHSFGIIHRDVKPSNFLHDRKNQKYLLVDFGLAQKNIVEGDSTNMLGESSKRKTSETQETENCSNTLNAPKRARNQYSQQLEQQQQSPISVVAPDENASQRRLNSSIPPSPFKSPLKQINEISSPKNTSKLPALDSALTRHIKSALLGYSIKAKMENQRSPSNPTAENPIKYNTDRRNTNKTVCYCSGKPMVCNICLVKKEIQASRAGTPGYRPPEVLLKCPNQSTAVDIWAIGVIMISILSACYPFFKASDDYTALAEITTVFGDEIIKKTALSLSRYVCFSRTKLPLHFRKLCIRLRNRTSRPKEDIAADGNLEQPITCDNCQQKTAECLCAHSEFNTDFTKDIFPDSAYDLMSKLLAIDPKSRITAAEALEHPFFKENL